MQYTKNCKLKKPATNEAYTVEDFNENADKIDEEITKLKTPRTINGMVFNGAENVNNYGLCRTSAGTEEKNVSINEGGNFELANGAEVTVSFVYGNTVAGATLNVNDTGGLPIYCNGGVVGTNNIKKGCTYMFKYDEVMGAWITIGELYDIGTANFPGLTKLYTSTGTAIDGTMTQYAITTELSVLDDKVTAKLPYYKHAASVDFNTLLETAYYSVTSQNTNAPTTNSGTVIVDFDCTTPYQLFIPSGNLDIYKRYITDKTNITFGDWGKINAGNSDTATKLANSKTINGTAFDGSTNIRTESSWNFNLGESGTAQTYKIFAKMVKTNKEANQGATFLIADGGDYGNLNTGAWIVQLTNRNYKPLMTVIALNNAKNITFGYYEDDEYFYFGACCTNYCAGFFVTQLSIRGTGNQYGKIANTTVVPDRWVTVDISYSLQPTASNTLAGIMKLYTGTGTNADGTMTQKSITEVLENKPSFVLKAVNWSALNITVPANSHDTKYMFNISDVTGVDGYAPVAITSVTLTKTKGTAYLFEKAFGNETANLTFANQTDTEDTITAVAATILYLQCEYMFSEDT